MKQAFKGRSDYGDDQRRPDEVAAGERSRGIDAGPDVHQDRRRAGCSTPRACATPSMRRASRGSTAASPSRARTSRPMPTAKGTTGPASTSYKAGDLIRVTLSFDLTKERRYVAVVDPLPAGFEPVESWFATTAHDLADQNDTENEPSDWWLLWEKGGFDHVEKHDDQVRLFATRLSEGHHEFSYIVRATTAGTYSVAPAHAEEMYEPEVFGRTATAAIDVKP